MASRRGSFGRSPRPTANLTNTIVAIAREMQAQEDQNIVDAWKSDGTYKGHKVTDEEILAYWKRRADQVDKNDPLYDTYQSAFMEYDYSIHESIIRTSYEQGKVSAAAVAAFYTNWSKKIPKNSEFWRILQRDAAQFLRAERAGSAARAAQAKEKRYRDDLAAIENQKVAPGAYLLDVFGNLAKRGLRPSGGDPLIDPMNGELYQFDAGDVQDMLGMITRLTDESDVVTNTGKGGRAVSETSGPTGAVLYHDDMGNAVTGQSVLAKLREFGYTGNLSLDNLYDLIGKQKEGLKQQADLATKTGHYTDATHYNNALSTVSEIGRQIKAWPVEQTYLDARNRWVSVVNDPHSSQQDIIDETNKYRNTVAKLAQDPSVVADDVFRNKLIAESLGNEGATTAAEDFTGLNQSTPAKDIAKANQLYERAQASIEAVANGAMWTAGTWDDKTGEFTPGPGGRQIGPATIDQIHNHSGGTDPQVSVVLDSAGRPIPVAVIGTPITVHSYAPDGSEIPIKPGSNPVVGYLFSLNGKQTVQYKDGKGNTLYSDISDAPWGGGAQLTGDPGGYNLRLNMPTGDLANTGFSLVNNGKQTVLQYDPYQAVLATDQEHRNVILNGGGDPTTDFRSYALAYYKDDPMGPKAVATLKDSPTFKQIVQAQSYLSTGFQPQYDANGGVAWLGGDQRQFDRATAQSTSVLSGGHSVASQWDRETPASDLLPDHRFEVTATGARAGSSFKPLGTSSLASTPFGAMGSHFQPGTLNPNFNDHGSSGIGDIKFKGAITVPSVGIPTNFGRAQSSQYPVTYTPPQPQYNDTLGPVLGGPAALNFGSAQPKPNPQALQSSYMNKQKALV